MVNHYTGSSTSRTKTQNSPSGCQSEPHSVSPEAYKLSRSRRPRRWSEPSSEPIARERCMFVFRAIYACIWQAIKLISTDEKLGVLDLTLRGDSASQSSVHQQTEESAPTTSKVTVSVTFSGSGTQIQNSTSPDPDSANPSVSPELSVPIEAAGSHPVLLEENESSSYKRDPQALPSTEKSIQQCSDSVSDLEGRLQVNEDVIAAAQNLAPDASIGMMLALELENKELVDRQIRRLNFKQGLVKERRAREEPPMEEAHQGEDVKRKLSRRKERRIGRVLGKPRLAIRNCTEQNRVEHMGSTTTSPVQTWLDSVPLHDGQIEEDEESRDDDGASDTKE